MTISLEGKAKFKLVLSRLKLTLCRILLVAEGLGKFIHTFLYRLPKNIVCLHIYIYTPTYIDVCVCVCVCE